MCSGLFVSAHIQESLSHVYTDHNVLKVTVHGHFNYNRAGWAMSHIYARVCDAPISYHGPCATSLPSVDTTEDKKHLEKICNIKW